MRKKREIESDDRRVARLNREAEHRSEQALAEEKSVDAAIRRSIKLHGA
jgi:hypothetical protein